MWWGASVVPGSDGLLLLGYGAHFIWGYFYNRYAGDGWELGARGFSTRDEYSDRGVTRQDFQHGSYWFGAMPTGFYTHDVRWGGKPNGYFCGPTSGYVILATVGATRSAADGGELSIDALASPWYLNTVGYGYTSVRVQHEPLVGALDLPHRAHALYDGGLQLGPGLLRGRLPHGHG